MKLHSIPVFFTQKMVADSASFSPSATKPAAVIELWREAGIALQLKHPEPVTPEDIKRVHDEKFVDGVLEGKVKNGFGNTSSDVAQSLPYTCGAMLAAAREALRNDLVAVAPVSGFHHAGYAMAEGFCTFNGLMIAAAALKNDGTVHRVGILDFDMHYGNGTDDIIEKLRADTWVMHYSAGRYYAQRHRATEFLRKVPGIVGAMDECDMILYQAGADPHINDPLGGWLTTEEIQLRDRLVFQTARRLNVPVAWNLAGGYQRDAKGTIRPVLEIHNNTFRECAAIYLD